MNIFVAACAGTVKEGMSRLQGQPLSVVVAKIGVPSDERTVAGKKVYIWGPPGLACVAAAIAGAREVAFFPPMTGG